MRIQVVPHDPAWRGQFEGEAGRITQVLGEIVVRLYHIGSTAIPDIWAKPIIDLLLEVESVTRLDDRRSALEALGYEALGEFGIPGRRYFRKDDAAGVRTHQVHAFAAGSQEVERHLAFRDYMREHYAAAQAYSALKQQLVQAHPDDLEAYMEGKDAFIKEHEAKALAWRSSQPAK
jgi:GrpB-like predicted nucleotidyltransferase (UPF0157 family)